jgi:hypothetical protein
MTVFATDNGIRFSSVIKHEYEPATAFCRDVVTVNDVAQTMKVGTVLGKVTATGKYKKLEATAADGSQNAAAIFLGDTLGNSVDLAVAATTDTKVLVLTRGPAFVSKSALVFGASVDTQGELDAAYAQLTALGMIPVEAV